MWLNRSSVIPEFDRIPEKKRVQVKAEVSAFVPLAHLVNLNGVLRGSSIAFGIKELVYLGCIGGKNFTNLESRGKRFAKIVILPALWINCVKYRLTGINH